MPEHNIWRNMLDRCLNPNSTSYKNYGNRGITVCNTWLKFSNFYKDMGSRITSSHSLDRIDNNKGYCKENCKWSTRKEQARNKRNTRKVTYNKLTKPLVTWCEELNLNYDVVLQRIDNSGYNIKKAF